MTLYLDNAQITSPTGAAIRVDDAEKATISTMPDTENVISDAATRTSDADAAIYSASELTLNGKGTLKVTGRYADGIKSTKKLRIMSGDISVTAVDDGISGKRAIGVRGGNINIKSGGDGMKSEEDNSGMGFVALEGGTLAIVSGGDGIAAKRYIFMNGDCSAAISSGGGAVAAQVPTATSSKGIKAGKGIYCEDGEYTISSYEDAVHSDGTITVNGGSVSISSADDGVHATDEIVINGGSIDITQCYEGIESDEYVEINGGSLAVTATDDGISVGASEPVSSRQMGEIRDEMPLYIVINGGETQITSSNGDGIDANGDIRINGGEMIISGSGQGAESAMDFDGSLYINGGTVLTAGSSGMNELPSEQSAQPIIRCGVPDMAPGSVIELRRGDDTLCTLTAKQASNLVFISSGELTDGEEYTIFVNGEVIETVKIDGIINQCGISTDGGVKAMVPRQ